MRIWALIAIVLLCSCAKRGGLQPGCPETHGWHVGTILNSSGAYLMLTGIGAAAFGLLALGASFFTAFIPDRLRGVLVFIAEVGACCIAIGSALVWLGNNPWVLGVAIGAALVALGIRYRRVIARWLGIRPHCNKMAVLAASHPVTVKDPE